MSKGLTFELIDLSEVKGGLTSVANAGCGGSNGNCGENSGCGGDNGNCSYGSGCGGSNGNCSSQQQEPSPFIHL